MNDATVFCFSPPDLSEARTRVSPWCHSIGKRLFDFLCAVLVLTLLSPFLLLMGILIRLTSPGPALFRQARVGKDGRQFTLFKFRTMAHKPGQAGPGITRQGDVRITRVGRVMRKWKLDEWPQFINVALGDMTLVGPRPDLAEYWAALSAEQRRVLCLRPGITGCATLKFRNEEELLGKVPREQLTSYYLSSCLPKKIHLDWEYAREATFRSDF